MEHHHHHMKWRTWGIGSGLILTSYAIALLFPGRQDLRYLNTSALLGAEVENHLLWQDFEQEGEQVCVQLQQAKEESGKLWRALAQKREVTVVGYGVPLELRGKEVVRMLLVPNDQFCVHIPPPPAHLMISVQVPEGMLTVRDLDGPLQVHGVPECSATNMAFGTARFAMVATALRCLDC
ncbi:MAG: DUF3299 domain-containing protein [Zetaproteobacteria bacterium]|nr:DUF3299 domain-containing protein [Zetaproteobacteria bacterium]